MKSPLCVGCGRVVLGLIGQFEKLDSYYLDDDGPLLESAGYWHTRCLAESPHGPSWAVARLRNHVDVRRFPKIAEIGDWTVIRDPRTRESLAFSKSGEFLHLEGSRGKPRKVEGGVVYKIVSPYNLELDDRELIAAMQGSLATTGRYSIVETMTAIGIADRINHPVALENAIFRFERSLRRHWQPNFVSAQAEYGRFVPEELEMYFPTAS